METIDVTFTTHDGNLLVLPVAATESIHVAKGFVTEALGLSAATHSFVHDGKVLDDSRSFASYGITSGELVLVEPKREPAPPIRNAPPARATGGAIDFGSLKGPGSFPVYKSGAAESELKQIQFSLLSNGQFMLQLEQSDPALASRVKNGDLHAVDEIVMAQSAQRNREQEEKRLLAEEEKKLTEILKQDPTNAEALGKIEMLKNRDAIQENMELAMEHTPEVFGSVVMLYINCKINGIAVKAFVDSGAQMTVINESLAKRCNVFHLLDRRFGGVAQGVGTSKILGRVHTANLEISGAFLPTSLTCLENQDVELLLGLDMLRRHQCCIDLHANVLRITSGGVQTHFLSESEFPEWATAKRQAKADANSEDAQK